MARPLRDRLWIDGEDLPGGVSLRLDRDAINARASFGDRAHRYSILQYRATARAPDDDALHQVEAHSADGRLRCLAWHCASESLRRQHRFIGMFFDLRPTPSATRQVIYGRRIGSVRLAIDGYLVLDPIEEASLEHIDGPPRGPWSASILRLRLAPGWRPTPWLTTLCQRRSARRLAVELDQGTFVLEEVGSNRARIITPSIGPLVADPHGLALELVLESRAPALDHAALDLVPRGPGASSGPRVERSDGERWLTEALDRARSDPFTAHLAKQLDDDAADHASMWAVFADRLIERGDARGHALALTLTGAAGSEHDAVMAALTPYERLIYQATRDRRPGRLLDEREWTPELQGQWVGPFLVRLTITPGWTRVVGATRSAPVHDDASMHVLSLPHGDRAGDRLPISSWQSAPGFWALPELERMLQLPCCAVLSPRRVHLDGW